MSTARGPDNSNRVKRGKQHATGRSDPSSVRSPPSWVTSPLPPTTISAMPAATDDLAADLQRLLPPGGVLTDPAGLFVYESDGFTVAKARPRAVVFPTSTQEVAGVVKLLARRGVQIIPRGSGTGLAGGCVAYEQGVVVSTTRMNRIFSIDLDNLLPHRGPGGRH